MTLLMPNPGVVTTFEPTAIANLFAWYRADLGVTKDGSDLVSQWDDQSGNGGPDLTASGSARPTHNSANFNSQDSISFDGSSDILTAASTQALPLHWFLAVIIDTWGHNDLLIAHNDLDGEPMTMQTSTPQVFQRDSEIFRNSISPTIGNRVLMQSFFPSGSGTWFQALNNDSQVTATGTDAGAATEISVGGDVDKPAQSSDIQVAELAIYSAEITSANLTNLKNYFNSRYSIY